MHPRAQSLIADLDLQPHPAGGYYREIFRSASRVQPGDHRAERSALTAIYFLLVAGQHSGWHQVLSDEIWSHLEGDTLELLCFDATNSQASTIALGRFSASGAAPIHVVPAGVWQAARPLGEYALLGCYVGPGFDFSDFRMAKDDAEMRNMEKFPENLRLFSQKMIDGAAEPSQNKPDQRYHSSSGIACEQGLKVAVESTKNQSRTIPMSVNNAGLVILQGFIKPLFSGLGLIDENNRFVTESAQRRALHCLQFLVTGCCETPENHQGLNKLLCGLELDEPVELGIELSTVEVDACQSLLNFVITHWREIGQSSIDGFRSNWLVRNGSLTHAKDHWDLIVEKRAYDLLLDRSPFSYSLIKLPWMETVIYVTWHS